MALNELLSLQLYKKVEHARLWYVSTGVVPASTHSHMGSCCYLGCFWPGQHPVNSWSTAGQQPVNTQSICSNNAHKKTPFRYPTQPRTPSAPTITDAGLMRKASPAPRLSLMHALRESLPYSLTMGQEGALQEILEDMQQDQPMMRLLQV